MIPRLRTLGLVALVAVLAGGLIKLNGPGQSILDGTTKPKPSQQAKNTNNQPSTQQLVSALGYLTPAGDVRRLSPPAQRVDGIPVLERLYVEEGQRINRNQLLASFDTRRRVASEISTIETKIDSLQAQIAILDSETKRYRRLAVQGAFSTAELESRELRLLELKTQLKQAKSERGQAEVEKSYSQLLSPINGVVLKIFTREGERPGPQGVMEVGASQRMEAIAQVSEDDIGRVQIGQEASITSENKSFIKTLQGRVIRIAPSVSPRRQLTLDSKADSDSEARTIEVRLAIATVDLPLVQDLSGAKIRVTFSP